VLFLAFIVDASFCSPEGPPFIHMSKKYIHKGHNFTLVPVELLTDSNLSLPAIGLAAQIIHQYDQLQSHNDAELFFDRITLAKGNYLGKAAYEELVDAGYINDFFKEGIEV
jgi:hypothetical protein